MAKSPIELKPSVVTKHPAKSIKVKATLDSTVNLLAHFEAQTGQATGRIKGSVTFAVDGVRKTVPVDLLNVPFTGQKALSAQDPAVVSKFIVDSAAAAKAEYVRARRSTGVP